jgi:hypothetical protein
MKLANQYDSHPSIVTHLGDGMNISNKTRFGRFSIHIGIGWRRGRGIRNNRYADKGL